MKYVKGKSHNTFLGAKNAPVSSQRGAFAVRTEDPRRLQEVVSRISTRDRPAGECKKKLKTRIQVLVARI